MTVANGQWCSEPNDREPETDAGDSDCRLQECRQAIQRSAHQDQGEYFTHPGLNQDNELMVRIVGW